jgi:hypothetical protein
MPRGRVAGPAAARGAADLAHQQLVGADQRESASKAVEAATIIPSTDSGVSAALGSLDKRADQWSTSIATETIVVGMTLVLLTPALGSPFLRSRIDRLLRR